MAMTATRCTGVRVSKGIVLAHKSWYNERVIQFEYSMACAGCQAPELPGNKVDPQLLLLNTCAMTEATPI
jgi:hypothetical protein